MVLQYNISVSFWSGFNTLRRWRIWIIMGGEEILENNIIAELVNIENRAKEVTEQTEQYRRNLPQRIAEKREEIESSVEREIAQKIEEVQDQLMNESYEKTKQLQLEAQSKFAAVEREYAANHEKWENEIFTQILGR